MSITATLPATEKKGRYLLNYGMHQQTAEGWTRPRYPEGHPKAGKEMFTDDDGTPILPQNHTYRANDLDNNIIPSDVDLAARDPRKFTKLVGDGMDESISRANRDLLNKNDEQRRRIEELERQLKEVGISQGVEPKTVQEEEDLSGLTIGQLKGIALNENVNIGGITKKEDIIAAIKLAREERE